MFPNLVTLGRTGSRAYLSAMPGLREAPVQLNTIKTRLRNRLTDKMLNSLLHLSINAPPSSSVDVSAIMQGASTRFVAMKERRKLPSRQDVQKIETEVGIASMDQSQSVRVELEAAVQELEDKLEVEMMHAEPITLLLKNVLLQFCDTGCNSASEPDATYKLNQTTLIFYIAFPAEHFVYN